MRKSLLLVIVLALLGGAPAAQTGQSPTTDIYFIDTEGGQAVLVVSPVAGISILRGATPTASRQR